MKAGTKKADEIHEYFVKLEDIMNQVIQEESEELRRQLQDSNIKTKELENKNTQLELQNEIDKHNMLCQQYDKTRLVYIMKLETLDDGKFIIKLGETFDIKQRCQAISTDFKIKVLIMDLFPCDKNYEFEQFLFKDPLIYKLKYKGLINKMKKSTETLLIPNMKTYKKIKEFIQRNIYKFNSKDAIALRYAAINQAFTLYGDDKEKIEKIIDKINASHIQSTSDAEIQPSPNLTNSFVPKNENHNDNEVNKLIQNTLDELYPQEKEELPISKPNTYSPKVQIYNPDDLTKVVKVFDSITEATREIDGTSYTHIKYASRHKTIYKNYRWHLVPNSDPNPSSPKDIGKTVNSNEKKIRICRNVKFR